MKRITKTSALLLSFITSLALVLAGCTAAVNTAYSQTTTAASPSSEVSALETPTASASDLATEQLSYVSIDVNPSVRLTIKDGVVVDAIAYNDDGAKIVLENNTSGLSPEEALGIYINAFAVGGYITNEGEKASLVITACGDNSDELLTNLQNTAAQQLTELSLNCDVVVSAVTNTIADEAKASGLTPGRYLALKYLADKEGITLDEAKAKYGSLRMGKIIGLLDDVDAVFGHKGDDTQLQELIDSGILTPEQIQILTQAQSAFKAAMQQAQEAFKQARTQAGELWRSSKTQIQNQFKSDKDAEKWKSAKDALKNQIKQQKQAALDAFKQAKAQAQEQFKVAVVSLGLTDGQIVALTEWGFDFDWDFDFDWSDGTNPDDQEAPQDTAQEDKGSKDVAESDKGKKDAAESDSDGKDEDQGEKPQDNGKGEGNDSHGNNDEGKGKNK